MVQTACAAMSVDALVADGVTHCRSPVSHFKHKWLRDTTIAYAVSN